MNEAFRQHVTSTTFVLTLGASHIAALAHIAHELARNHTLEEDVAAGTLNQRRPVSAGPLRRAFAHNATGMNGLLARGLVTHDLAKAESLPVGTWRPSDIWTITRAGQLVIELLTEASIWQEFTEAFSPLELVAGGTS